MNKYAEVVRSDGAVGYWRLGDAEGYAQAVLSDGPVGYWRLNGDAKDAAPAPHNGTVTGGVVFGASGPLADGSTAASFDGASGTTVRADPGFGVIAAFSCEIWVSPASLIADTAPGRVFLSLPGGAYLSHYSSAGTVYFAAFPGGLERSVTGVGVTVGQWTHIVGTYDGDKVRLYVNGVLVRTSASFPGAVNLGASAYLGSHAGGYLYPGLLSGAAVYNYALSPQQVANHYALRTSAVTAVGAMTVADVSGNGRTGNVVKGVTLQQAGPIGDGNKGALFDGITGTVDVPTPYVPGINSFTVEAWVTLGVAPYPLGQTAPVVVGSGGQPGGWRIRAHRSGTTTGWVIFEVYDGAGWFVTTWNFFAAELAGTVYFAICVNRTARTATLFTNGVNRTAIGLNSALNNLLLTCGQFQIGKDVWHGTGWWPGLIDEVAVYPRALTPEQVLNHYRLASLETNPGAWARVRGESRLARVPAESRLARVPRELRTRKA